MTDIPTREQVQQLADYLEQQYLDSDQHMSTELIDILGAALLWLEGSKVTDEMIERGTYEITKELLGLRPSEGQYVFEPLTPRLAKPIVERVLRAALEGQS